MTVVIITREAKCKDCKFLLPYYRGKRKRHKCSNEKSKCYDLPITLNDLVCENWEL